MKPKLLLLESINEKALELLKGVVDIIEYDSLVPFRHQEINGIFTKLTYGINKEYGTPIGIYDKINLKFIATPCTGIDHINSEYCNYKDIKIIHLDETWKQNEGKEITSTAEHTMSLILQLAKMNRIQLKGKKLGIIGYGRIGQQVEEYAMVFKMNCVFYDIDGITSFGTLEELLEVSDVITIHVPLNELTKGMISKEQFELMKPGALLINTSRAEVVDEMDLILALESGQIASYADDFYDSHGKYLTNSSQVISTNHIGGNCLEAREATDIYIAKQIINYIKGESR